MVTSAGVVRTLCGATLLASLLVSVTSISNVTSASAGTPLPGAPGCPMFPADNVWNTDIANLPVDAAFGAVAGQHGRRRDQPASGLRPVGGPVQPLRHALHGGPARAIPS